MTLGDLLICLSGALSGVAFALLILAISERLFNKVDKQ